ncbi:hypothetical protein [Priestia megaterium]|uniref:hypothetical protein n=1 Tax=Priestia megaterium TaxID=1404 RepID=UPI0018A32763|nr:hypothetical protein [Priestia megaterium]
MKKFRGKELGIGDILQRIGALIAMMTIILNIFIENFTIATLIIITCEALIVIGYFLNKKKVKKSLPSNNCKKL